MNKKVSVLLLILMVSPFALSKGVSQWNGRDWNKLSHEAKQYVILGYMFASSAINEGVNFKIAVLEEFLNKGQTLDDIVLGVDLFYSQRGNLDKPIYKIITIIYATA